ncbi:hypothetical protein HDV62DRAFT_163084 [Trichoderma sp. SZMC 28011]
MIPSRPCQLWPPDKINAFASQRQQHGPHEVALARNGRASNKRGSKRANKQRFGFSIDEKRERKGCTVLYGIDLMFFVFLLHHNATARLETVDVAFQIARTSTEFYAQWRSRRLEDDVWPSASSSIRSVRTVNGTGTWMCVASIATESAMEW